jgi:hypothetical protein
MEAMLTGTPIVSIGPEAMWMPDLFEAYELVGTYCTAADANRIVLPRLLAGQEGPYDPSEWSAFMRARAIELFDVATVGPQWNAHLGARVAVAA